MVYLMPSELDIQTLETRQLLRSFRNYLSNSSTNVNDQGYDIIVAWGASNTVSYGEGINTALDYPSHRVLQYATTGSNANTIIQALDPLAHNEIRANTAGAFVTMGREYSALLPNNRSVLIVPVALSGAGFAENRWNPGNDLYNDMVSRINTLLALSPKNRLVAFVNSPHGGGDVNFNSTDYRNRWLAFIDALRTLYGEVPFIISSYPDTALVASGGVRQLLQNVIVTLPTLRPRVFFVDGAGLSNFDELHYSATAQRELGRRYANVLKLIKGGFSG